MFQPGTVRKAAAAAARSGLIIACTVVLLMIIRVLLEGRNADWQRVLIVAAAFGAGSFVFILVSTLLRFHANQPVIEILTEAQSSHPAGAMGGFVAMEYYWLILNRTYVVFTSPQGLYGWKVFGPVDCSRPKFYAPFAEMLKDQKLMTDAEAARKLSALKGGFFIPRHEIVSAEPIYRKKWGMGPIPHSGLLKLRLRSGRTREFILLGASDPRAIQESVMSGAPVEMSSPAATR